MPHPRHAFRPVALGGLLMVVPTLGCSSLTGTSMSTADVIGRAVTLNEEFAPEPEEDIDVAPPYWPAPDPFEGIAGFRPWDGTAEADRLTPPIIEPTPEPPPVTWVAGPPEINGNDIIARAQEMLGIPCVWGGNKLAGLDCSAYVSRAWGISRQITDTLHLYSTVITKDELLPGDAMNLTKREDPRGYGHVRIFSAWANEERTRMWVYEETPRQSIHHVIAYDDRYTPIRRANFVSELTEAPLVPAPAPKRRAPRERSSANAPSERQERDTSAASDPPKTERTSSRRGSSTPVTPTFTTFTASAAPTTVRRTRSGRTTSSTATCAPLPFQFFWPVISQTPVPVPMVIPTPAPTAAPEPTTTPELTPTPEPTPVAVVAESPTPTPTARTPRTTRLSTATARPDPTATPEPTAVAAVAESPMPTPTAQPPRASRTTIATPRPEPTPTPRRTRAISAASLPTATVTPSLVLEAAATPELRLSATPEPSPEATPEPSAAVAITGDAATPTATPIATRQTAKGCPPSTAPQRHSSSSRKAPAAVACADPTLAPYVVPEVTATPTSRASKPPKATKTTPESHRGARWRPARLQRR